MGTVDTVSAEKEEMIRSADRRRKEMIRSAGGPDRRSREARGRIEWIDFAKGLTMLLVIAGHSLLMESGLRAAIFSFHMPLFFILSGITFHYADSADRLVKNGEKAFRHLVLPAFCMVSIATALSCIRNYTSFLNVDYTKQFIRLLAAAFTFSSGSDVEYLSSSIPAIGMPWFLIVLFLGRGLFDYIQYKCPLKKTVLFCVLLSVAGVLMGKLLWLPLSFDIALAIQPFFLLGKEFDRVKAEQKPLIKLIVFAVLWAVLFFLPRYFNEFYFELSCRRYIWYPLCFVTAAFGTLMISELSVLACRLPALSRYICALGKDSLTLLFIHVVDDPLWGFLWSGTDDQYARACIRIASDVFVFSVLMLLLKVFRRHKTGNA